MNPVPVVMAFSGLDPSGGAGIQADIEAISSMGSHCAPVITCLTAQDTHGLYALEPVSTTLFIQQARAVLADIPIAIFKIGLLGSIEIVTAIHAILMDYPQVPVIFDPIVKTGGGQTVTDATLCEAVKTLLFPLTTLLTPNSEEARQWYPEADNLNAAAQALMDQGCQHVLITGTHEKTSEVINNLYGNRTAVECFTWQRLPFEYHGSGCTLSAAIAGLLAQNIDLPSAVQQAQQYTWDCLRLAYRIGQGQYIPNRLHWVSEG